MDGAGTVISGAADGSVVTWKPQSDVRARETYAMKKHSTAADLMPDGKSAIIGYDDGSIERFDLDSGLHTVIRQSRGVAVRDVAIEPNGNWCLIGFEDGRVDHGSMIAGSGSEKDHRWKTLPLGSLVHGHDVRPFEFHISDSGQQICLCRGGYNFQWIDLTINPESHHLVDAVPVHEFRTDTAVETVARLNSDTIMLIGESIQISRAKRSQQILPLGTDRVDGMLEVRSSCTDYGRPSLCGML